MEKSCQSPARIPLRFCTVNRGPGVDNVREGHLARLMATRLHLRTTYFVLASPKRNPLPTSFSLSANLSRCCRDFAEISPKFGTITGKPEDHSDGCSRTTTGDVAIIRKARGRWRKIGNDRKGVAEAVELEADRDCPIMRYIRSSDIIPNVIRV